MIPDGQAVTAARRDGEVVSAVDVTGTVVPAWAAISIR
jgi:hypothetical protein